MIINVLTASYKFPVILVRFQSNWNFLDEIKKNSLILNFMKRRTVGAKLSHENERTDERTGRHDEANSRFSKFCKSAYNGKK
jgi:hypothetical protein